MSLLNRCGRRRLILLISTMILLAVGLRTDAAYRITSPIDASYEHVRQDYLYGISGHSCGSIPIRTLARLSAK